MNIYPSLISADVLNLRHVLTTLDPYCEGYHLDIMDDHFVPNLTWGPMFINAIAATTTRPLQVHLMVDNPTIWIDRLTLKAKDSFIFHHEAVDAQQATTIIQQVETKQVRVGVAINPTTPVNSIEALLAHVDEVLVMSVNPGFSGQAFIDVTDKIDQLKTIRSNKNLNFTIGMDGGINNKNISLLKEHGVEFVGVAAAIFHEPDIIKAIKSLR